VPVAERYRRFAQREAHGRSPLYGGTIVGDPAAPLRLACQPRGPVPVPTTLPEVVWRRGIDLDPVDLHDPDAVRWLECCVWPDQPERLARLQAAVGVARADPPEVVRGDLLELVGPAVADAPAGATVVVFHAAALVYVSEPGRQRFAAEGPDQWLGPAQGGRGHGREQVLLDQRVGLTARLPVASGWCRQHLLDRPALAAPRQQCLDPDAGPLRPLGEGERLALPCERFAAVMPRTGRVVAGRPVTR
jgi:hypothetical protein